MAFSKIKKKIKRFIKENCRFINTDYNYEELDYISSSNVCYVVKRKDKIGLFSFFITNLGALKFLKDRGCNICISDLEEIEWNSFFELRESYKKTDHTKFIEFDSAVSYRPDDSMDNLTNARFMRYWHDLFYNNFCFEAKVSEYINKQYELYLKGKENRTIGVICRGTDYLTLKPYMHPRQPKAEDLYDRIDILLNENKYKYIYLVTEDNDIYEKFKERYKEKIISIPQNRISLKEKKFLFDVIKENNLDTYSRNLDYLTAIVLLSKCKALVGGRSSGTVAAMVLSEGFSDVYLWNQGRYGDVFE